MIPADEQDVVRALTDVATLGDIYQIRTDQNTRNPLLDTACTDETAVGERLTRVGVSLGTCEARAAASSVQYELAERLWAVSIAVWSHCRIVVDPGGFRVGSTAASWSLSTSQPRGWRCDAQAADVIARAVLPRLYALHRTLRSHTSIAEGLLWGNAATAATLAVRAINDVGARALVTDLLTLGPLRNRLAGQVGGTVTRRSCCLYYRTRHARTCGDCPLRSSTAAKLAAGGSK
ncbi:(2Fe-2S)-binding protein [Actinokineospora sp. HUAS TT18]|uniref:(2Fe-2S)-binding protein n=1 Tax=Actinokineospora sp. HUAS TT18 TaxID=3447451 RepID=UPI003F51D5B5